MAVYISGDSVIYYRYGKTLKGKSKKPVNGKELIPWAIF
jgi:hypothetical protein